MSGTRRWYAGTQGDRFFVAEDVDAASARHDRIVAGEVGVEADADLCAAAPALLEACEAALAWLDYSDVTAHYDRLADAFHRDTGYMAPGKSVPLEMNPGEEWEAERAPAWHKWCAERRAALCSQLRAALSLARGGGR